MARYFQHLNQNDAATFQQVTELDRIDDTDPGFVLYYFKDGTKCSQDFVAPLNANDVIGKFEFAEVSSPKNKWQFKIEETITGSNPTPKFYTDPNTGQTYEIPSEDELLGTFMGKKANPIVTTLRKPMFVDPSTIDMTAGRVSLNENEGLATADAFNPVSPMSINNPRPHMDTEKEFNFDLDDSMPEMPAAAPLPAPVMQQPVTQMFTASQQRQAPARRQMTPDEFMRNIDTIYTLSADETVKHSFVVDGMTYRMSFRDLINNGIRPRQADKADKKQDVNIPIKINDAQKALVDNMIDLASKDNCDIEMSLTLKLPSTGVYDVLKKNYPEELSRAFVNIIANRMQVKDLKMAVAAGLLGYYDGDVEEEDEPEQITPVISAAINEVQVARRPRKKQAAKKDADK